MLSHSSGIQNPFDSTLKSTNLHNLIIENKPIVTNTAFGSGDKSLSHTLTRRWYFKSAESATALPTAMKRPHIFVAI